MSNIFDPSRYVLDTVAGIIDSPSLYMGGPSRDALRKARYIVQFFQTDAIAIEAATAGETAQTGSTEGKSAGPQDIAQPTTKSPKGKQ